jgi:hypothetical protein
LGKYYPAIVDLADTYAEAYSGCYEKIKDFPENFHNAKDPQKYLANIKTYVEKNRDALLKTTKEQTKAIKEQTALQKAGTLFDIQQISIIAALKGQVTDEERKRLELQLAILTGNTSEASKLAGELAKSQGLSQQLAAYLKNLPDAKNPFTAWKNYLDMLEAQVRMIASVQPGAVATNVPAAMGNPQGVYPLETGSQGNFTYGQNTAPDVSVIVTLDGQEMAGAVTKVQTNNYLSNKIIQLERLESQFR